MSSRPEGNASGYATDTEPFDILLVEDNPGDVRLTREAFEAIEVETSLHVVSDGVQALEFLHQRGEYADATQPDIVLLDLNLPRKNGDAVLAELRSDPELPRVPVVVLTGSEAEEDIVRSYELEANAYLTKPVEPEMFSETIEAFEAFWLSEASLPPVRGC
jgi:CheY-like chemotaxis protein